MRAPTPGPVFSQHVRSLNGRNNGWEGGRPPFTTPAEKENKNEDNGGVLKGSTSSIQKWEKKMVALPVLNSIRQKQVATDLYEDLASELANIMTRNGAANDIRLLFETFLEKYVGVVKKD